MFNRRNGETTDHVDDAGAGHHPERLEAAEFTMSSTPDVESSGPRTESSAPVRESRVLDQDQIDHRRSEWDELQARFIDDPHKAVQEADQIIASTIDDISRACARERESLEQGWKDADDANTEDLRITFQRYRELMDRLLSL